jgi:hypothetical protein
MWQPLFRKRPRLGEVPFFFLFSSFFSSLLYAPFKVWRCFLPCSQCHVVVDETPPDENSVLFVRDIHSGT